jgi:hypothetical protein
MSNTEALRALLWPPGGTQEVYAVLDGARDRIIEPLVQFSLLEHDCLTSEPLDDDLRNASAFVVRLEPGPAATQLMERGWGKAWGIHALAPAETGLARVARHLKRLTKVLDPSGQVMTFRFYDPRVLRVFLPTVDAAQRAEMFGPLSAFVAEDLQGRPAVFRKG